MSKVICDICGTAYPSSAANCPICGSSREFALENKDEDLLLEAELAAAAEEVAAQPRKKNKEIFDFDEVNQVRPARRTRLDDDFDDDDDEDDDDDDDEEESHTNVGLVIVLVILIVLLLLTAGFFFLKYLLPNMTEPEQTEPIVTTAAVETEPAETTDPVIPCQSITIVEGGKIELGKDGKFLMNVNVYPEDTTDALTFVSGDETVVTVSESGDVVAVGEGQTTISVQCGTQCIVCNVTVDYTEEETVPEGTIPALEVEDSTDPTGETQDATEATEATDAAQETVAADAKLKLKKEDITIGANHSSVKLELEGDVDPSTLKWFTMDSTVAIVHDGVVTSTGSGLTRIYGEANGQQVMCIVRCVF